MKNNKRMTSSIRRVSATMEMLKAIVNSGILALLISLLELGLVNSNFATDMSCIWGPQNFVTSNNGNNMALSLTNASGCAVQSNKQFLFGSTEMQIKLVGGNSAGVVTTCYMSSTGNNHDEIDFEFLGNLSGQPYIIHTNIFVHGVGNREVQFYPWFNPTTDFHNYTIHWSPCQVVWFIDGTPIRVFKNYENRGIPFPNHQGMNVYSSIWNGDAWATQGGHVKIDWRRAPFTAMYYGLGLRACPWSGTGSTAKCSSSTPADKLSSAQQAQLMAVRNKYMIYDYCKHSKRFNGDVPPECSLPMF